MFIQKRVRFLPNKKGMISTALVAVALSMPMLAHAWTGWFEENELKSSVAIACGNGATGNFQIFNYSYNEGCDWVGVYDLVECEGGGKGRVTGQAIIRLRQQGPCPSSNP